MTGASFLATHGCRHLTGTHTLRTTQQRPRVFLLTSRSLPVAARKKKNLVIVESPAKARTINKYLGADFEVVASKGHVRDLPKSRFGIDIENGWVPTYRPLQDRKDVLTALKKHAASAGMVYLAPD